MLALSACGGSGASSDTLKITLGRVGGLVPYEITIAPGGAVTAKGIPPAKPTALTGGQDEQISKLVRQGFGKLKSEQCAGSFPDEATEFITAMGKTVSVRGNCEPGFTTLWDSLTSALGLNQ